jgi:NAD(P)-dependent dehydrogenase (short-subunit alcohol dehydrogenase family)
MDERAPLDFAGTVVLVTGGTRGIGRAITERFLAAGADVVVCGRNQPDDALGEFVPCDVRDPEQVESLVNVVAERHGHLDVAVNNAGGAPPAEAATVSPRFTERVVQLNLLAPLYVAQAANRVMQGQPAGGSIINITSLSGMRASPGSAAYGAAKAGLINATKSLAIEWAPKVRVNAVSAGLVLTEDSRAHYGDDESVARVAATVPAGRMGDPTDVADACLYLASPLSSYVSGANLEVHGGGERPPFLGAVDG